MDTSVKVHIVLSEGVRQSDETLAQASKRLIDDFHVKGLNSARLHRYGIASGEMPVRLVQPLADSDFVESVTSDEVREVGKAMASKRGASLSAAPLNIAPPSAPTGTMAKALSVARALVGR
jgi:hypothetical protein